MNVHEAKTQPMFDTRDQILNQLRAGEDGRAEFKDVRLGKRGKILRTARRTRAGGRSTRCSVTSFG